MYYSTQCICSSLRWQTQWLCKSKAPTGRRAHGGGDAASGVSMAQTATGADLGGSSKYSNESFEELDM